MTTGKIIIDRLYRLLNDTNERRSDDTPFYDPAILLQIVTSCRENIFDYLLAKSKMGNRSRTPLMQRFGRITISRMLKPAGTATSGSAVPTDFWQVCCGFDSNGQYVPPKPIYYGDAMAYSLKPGIWVRAGVFLGTAATAYYWAKPSQAIAYDNTVLTDFPDAFYDCLVTLAALEAIQQENMDVKSRYAELEVLFTQQLESLR